MRTKIHVALFLSVLALVLQACGGGEKARQDQVVELRDKVEQGTRDEQHVFEIRGEVAQLRGRVNNLLSDPLRQDTESLEQRLLGTGERMGLRLGALRATEILQGEGPLRWQIYQASIRGRNQYLKRWLQDLVNWPVGLYPLKIVATDDPRTATSYRGTLTLAVPLFALPPEAAEPPEPKPAGPQPQEDDETAHELWRLRQNLARIEAAKSALPGFQKEKAALEEILAALDAIPVRGREFVEAFDAVLNAGERAGALQGYVVEPGRVEVTATVPTDRAGEDLAQSLGRVPSLEPGRVVEREQTRVGLRVVVEARRTGDPLVQLSG